MNINKESIIEALKEKNFYQEEQQPFVDHILSELSEGQLFSFLINGIQQAVLSLMIMSMQPPLPNYPKGGYSGTGDKKEFKSELAKLHNKDKNE